MAALPNLVFMESNATPRSNFKSLLLQLQAEHERGLDRLQRDFDVERQRWHADHSRDQDIELCLSATKRSITCGTGSPTKSSCHADNSQEIGKRSNSDSTTSMTNCDSGEEMDKTGTVLQHHVRERMKKITEERTSYIDTFIRRQMRQKTVTESSRCQLMQWVQTSTFDTSCACMIVGHAIFLGVSTSFDPSLRDTHSDTAKPRVFKIVDYFFSAWFVAELVLRALAEGIYGFLCFSRNVRWNHFDCVLVGTDAIDVCIQMLAGGDAGVLGDLTIMRMMRVLRVARAVRIIRLVTLLTELRMMVLSIMRSGMSLLWSMVLLFMIIYIFGIYVMQAVSQHLEETPDADENGELRKLFGALPNVTYTLFLCVSGGVNWGQVTDLLIEIHWSNGLVLAFFIFFTIFVMLNIITGIFVETTITSVRRDKDEVIQAELNSENTTLKKLQQIFQEADKHNLNCITIHEFEEIMTGSESRALLSTMGLEVHEARTVFNLIDSDSSGLVSIEEFLVGCMRIKGHAREVDLVTLMYETKKIMDRIHYFEVFFEDQFECMRQWEARIDDTLSALSRNYRASEHALYSQRDSKKPACLEAYGGHRFCL